MVLEKEGTGLPGALLCQLVKYMCLPALAYGNVIHVDGERFSSVS